jgi:DNA relaxase NicK
MLQAVQAAICKPKDNRNSGPSSNTGLLGIPEVDLKGDQVKLSFRRELLPCEPQEFARMILLEALHLVRGAGWNFTGATMTEKGQNGFERGFYLRCAGEVRASFQWGGKSQLGWCLLHINGAFCKVMTRKEWVRLYALSRRFQARLGAFDLAGDDYTGLLGFQPCLVRAEYYKAPVKFCPGHRIGHGSVPPRFRKWIDSETGTTLYLGGEKSSIGHRVYEKGKQLGDKARPDWHRWEVMFRRMGGKTELNLGLLYPGNWASAWLGSCNHLATKFDQSGLRFTMNVEQARRGSQEIAARSLLTLEKQWGGAIDHLAQAFGSEALIELIRRKVETSPLSELDSSDIASILELRESLRSATDSAAGADAAQSMPQRLTYAQEMIRQAWRSRDVDGKENVFFIEEKLYYSLGEAEHLCGSTELHSSEIKAQGEAIGLDLVIQMDLCGDRFIMARER